MTLQPQPPAKQTDDLTRQEASLLLAELGVRLKPATLARLWSTGSRGPPCRHIRSRPYYPRGLLLAWAAAQTTEVRAGAPAAAQAKGKSHVSRTVSGSTLAACLQDPGVSFALKAVIEAWSGRDVVDAARDAEILSRVFDREFELTLERMS